MSKRLQLKTLYLSGLCSLLIGCATPPDPFPAWDIPEASTDVQRPLTTPDRPKAATHTEDTITFNRQGMDDLEEFFQIAVSNEVISQANANALQSQAMAFNSLLQAAEFQRQIGIIKSELLELERSNHFWDNLFYRIAIALGLIVAVL